MEAELLTKFADPPQPLKLTSKITAENTLSEVKRFIGCPNLLPKIIAAPCLPPSTITHEDRNNPATHDDTIDTYDILIIDLMEIAQGDYFRDHPFRIAR